MARILDSGMAQIENEPAEPLTPNQEAIGLAKWQRLLTVVATLLALLALAAVAVRLGMAIHHTLLLFALGGLVAYALEPLVDLVRRPRLRGRSLGRTPGVFVVFVALAALFAGGVAWLGGHAVREVKVLERGAPRYQERALKLAHDFDANVLKPRNVEFSVEDTLRDPPPEVGVYERKMGQEALPLLSRTVKNVAESVIVLLIALYFLVFGADMKERANRALPPFLRQYALPWEEDVARILGGFVRGQLVLALLSGACAAVGLLLLGVHLWLLIGAFVVAASLIPVFGPYIGAIPAVLAALVGPTRLTPVAGAVVVAILFVVITEAGSKVLYPRLVGKALNLHEVVVLFVLFAGLEVDGIVGTLFAAPITSLVIVTLVHLYRLWQQLPEEPIADSLGRNGGDGPRLFKRPRETG